MARMKKPRSKKSRIRREIKPKPNREFVVGERILATWSDGKKYPARVTSVYGNGKLQFNLAFNCEKLHIFISGIYRYVPCSV